jgi:hypothetical protein
MTWVEGFRAVYATLPPLTAAVKVGSVRQPARQVDEVAANGLEKLRRVLGDQRPGLVEGLLSTAAAWPPT